MSTTIANASVRISADITGLREEIQAGIRTALAGPDPKVGVGADTSKAEEKFAATRAEADRLGAKRVSIKVDASSGVNDAEKGLSGLMTTVVTLGPALIPVTAAVTAGFAGMAAAFGSVALGAGVVKLASTQLKAAITEQLTPALHQLQATAAGGLMPGFDKLLHDLLPLLAPVNKLVGDLAHTMGDLAAQAGRELDSGGAAKFIRFLDAEAGRTLTTVVHVIENLVKGFAGLAEASAPLVNQVGHAIQGLSADFARFGQNAGHNSFQGFLDYVRTNGPLVARAAGDIATAAGHLVVALAPLGHIALTGLDVLARDITRIPVHDITAIAAAAAALAVGLKGFQGLQGLAGLLEPLGLVGPEAVAAVAGIAALSGALVYAYQLSAPFRSALQSLGRTLESDLGPAVQALAGFFRADLLPVLKRVADDALQGLIGVIHSLDRTLQSNRPQLEELGRAFLSVAKFITRDLLPVLGPLLKAALRSLGQQITIAIRVISGLVDAFNVIRHAGQAVGSFFSGPFVHFFERAAAGVKHALDDVVSFVKSIPHRIVAAVGDLSHLLYQAGRDVIQGLINGMKSMLSSAVDTVKGIGSSIKNTVTGFFGIGSPSKLFHQFGEWMMEGLANGLRDGGHLAVEATRKVYAAIAAAVAPDFGTRLDATVADGITPHSVARFGAIATNVLGRDTRRAISLREEAQAAGDEYRALKAAADAADAHAKALDRLARQADREAQNAKTSTAAEKAHAKALADSAHAADQAAKAADKAAAQADRAAQKGQQAWQKAKQAADDAAQRAASDAQTLMSSLSNAADAFLAQVNDFESQISSGITGDYSLQTIWQSLVGTDENGNPVNPTVEQVQGKLDSILAQTKKFAADLNTLLGEGAGKDLILQLTQLGSVAGDQLAQELISAGPGAISAMQKTMAGINDVATGEARSLGTAFFSVGAELIIQMLKGLEKAFPELRKQLKAIVGEIKGEFDFGGDTSGTTSGRTTQGASPPRVGGTPAPGTVTVPTLTPVPGLAPLGSFGGSHFAAGTLDAVGGIALVGEHGPEFVTLPPHAVVSPNGMGPRGSDGASLFDVRGIEDRLDALNARMAGMPVALGDVVASRFERAAESHARTVVSSSRLRYGSRG